MRFDTVLELETIGRAGAKLVEDDFGTRARYLSSFWLYVEPEDQAFTPHWPTGYWESWVSCWLSKQWENTDLFIDIGANVGYFSFQAIKAGVQTIAVEPNPKLSSMIGRSNFVNNNRVEIWDWALSDYNGKATLWVPEGHSGGAHLSDTAEGFEVDVWTLDSIFSPWRRNISVTIKIDAEGEEPKIWAGMQKTLARHDCQVLLEWHGVRYDRVAFAEELMKHDVFLIDYEGNEIPVDQGWLVHTPDLHMILVRPNKEAF